MTYVVLLRGVNVGGGNRVPMKELKELLEGSGFVGVSTYINSGNLILTCEILDTVDIAKTVQQLIKDAFSVDCSVLVISKEDYLRMVARAPEWWGKAEGWKHNALFILPPTTPEDVIDAIGPLKPGIEQLSPVDGVVFQSLLFTKFGQTSSGKLAGTPIYKQLTIRNYNTTMRLTALLQQ